MVGIYKITSPSGKVYIGQSRNIKRRWWNYRNYKTKGQPKLHRSLIKYGVDKHIFDIVCELPIDIEQETLNTYEVLYWELYIDCGVSMLNTKEPGSFGKHSVETKIKMSIQNTGELNNFYGKVHTKLSKDRMSESRIGNINRLGKKGNSLSDETKHKMSIKRKGVKHTKEHSHNIRVSNPLSTAIEQYDLKGNYIQSFLSMRQASIELGFGPSNIARWMRGDRTNTSDYIFKFKE